MASRPVRSVSMPFPGPSIADDEDEARQKYRQGYQSFRRGNAAGCVGEQPRKPIKTNCKLSQSVPDLRSKRTEEIRAQYDAFAILDGVEVPRIRTRRPSRDRPATPPTTEVTNLPSVIRLAAVALLTGTLCQLQVELLLRDDAAAGNLISLVEYSYCALVSSSSVLTPRRLPWACHLQLLLSGVLYSALTNAGLAMRSLPFATALVIKNGNIIANMIVGRVAGRRYSSSQALAAAVISAGLVVSTVQRASSPPAIALADTAATAAAATAAAMSVQDTAVAAATVVPQAAAVAQAAMEALGPEGAAAMLQGAAQAAKAAGAQVAAAAAAEAKQQAAAAQAAETAAALGAASATALVAEAEASSYMLGVVLLVGALLARAAGGVAQEKHFAKHGIHTNEVMFWRAVLGIPVFAARFDVGGLAAWCTPQRVALLLGNVVCDHLCKVAMTRLIGEASALAATMVITLQRFISLVFRRVTLDVALTSTSSHDVTIHVPHASIESTYVRQSPERGV